jgi:hypothetical protein
MLALWDVQAIDHRSSSGHVGKPSIVWVHPRSMVMFKRLPILAAAAIVVATQVARLGW